MKAKQVEKLLKGVFEKYDPIKINWKVKNESVYS